MEFNLSGKYTATEKILFSFIPKDGRRINSGKLVEKLTAHRVKREYSWPVDYPRNTVSTTMRHLIKKIEAQSEKIVLRKTHQRGPYPTEYWIEPRIMSKKTIDHMIDIENQKKKKRA
jgi:predicted SAM-dependent methyltransferase